MTRGSLFCIGAAKSGTTWLYKQLRNSPDLYFTPEKEINFFFSRFGDFNRLSNVNRFKKLASFVDGASKRYKVALADHEFASRFVRFQKNLDWYETFAQGPVTDAWYRRLFAASGSNQYLCDFSPSTSKISVEGITALRRFSDQVKLIYILRDPIDRLWSHLKFHAQFTGKFELLKTYTTDQMIEAIQRNQLQVDGNYGTALNKFLSVFDKSDILVLDFDDIRIAPEKLLARVTDFLDIPPLAISPNASDAVNKSEHLEMPPLLMESFKKDMRNQARIVERLGYGFASNWAENLR